MNKTIFFIIVVVIGVGIFMFAQVITDSAEREVKDGESMEKEGIIETMTKPDRVNLEAVGDYKGNGVATRFFDNGIFVHNVTAQISDPATGKFYEGWLVKKTAGVVTDFFSTGKLELNNGSYELHFSSKTNYPDHDDIVITEETESLGLDGKPETHVLEGSF
jgi:hypothetical protein